MDQGGAAEGTLRGGSRRLHVLLFAWTLAALAALRTRSTSKRIAQRESIQINTPFLQPALKHPLHPRPQSFPLAPLPQLPSKRSLERLPDRPNVDERQIRLDGRRKVGVDVLLVLEREEEGADPCAMSSEDLREASAIFLERNEMGTKRTFSLIPPTGVTFPLNVISPVIATPLMTGIFLMRETMATTIATPALGPSFLIDPEGRCRWMSIPLKTSSLRSGVIPNS